MRATSPLIELPYKFGEYFTKRDTAGLQNLFHEDFALYDPALKWVKGRDKVFEVLNKEFIQNKHISYEIIDAFQDKNVTILRFEINMDDRKFVGVDFLEWQGEKIKELVCYYNPPNLEDPELQPSVG